MLQDFLLMLLFKELIDCLFLLLIKLMVVPIKLKETVIKNISSQEYISPIIMYYMMEGTLFH